jgi:hypothetical protein
LKTTSGCEIDGRFEIDERFESIGACVDPIGSGVLDFLSRGFIRPAKHPWLTPNAERSPFPN